MKKQSEGITLVALVVTIIILLILVGITISALNGENGLIVKVNQAKKAQIEAKMKEKLVLAINELQTEKEGAATIEDITQKWANEKLNEYSPEVRDENNEENKEKTITLTKSGVTKKYKIKVDLSIEEIELSEIMLEYEIGLKEGDEVYISIKISSEEGLNQIITPNAEADPINCNGKKEVGIDYKVKYGVEYIFTIITESGKQKQEKVLVLPEMVKKITLNKESKVLRPNDTFKLEATIEPENAANKNIIWSSENEEVATVSEDGTVTAKTEGITNIKVKAQDESGVSATCKINVNPYISDYTVLNYPIDVDGDGDYTTDWNVLYEGEEGLYLIASKCINYSKYDTDKFISHGYVYAPLSETNPKYFGPWDQIISGVGRDYIPSLERLSEIPGNEKLLDVWNKLSDSDKEKWKRCEATWAYNWLGPSLLDYNMWTGFVAQDIGDLCIGSPTIELIQLSKEWCGKARINFKGWSFSQVWGFTNPGITQSVSFDTCIRNTIWHSE